MATLLAVPLFVALVMLQTVVIRQLNLISGSADLILLVLIAWGLQEQVKNTWFWVIVGGGLVSFVSAVPFPVLFIGYLFVMLVVRLLQRRVWQTPILAMFVASVIGTIVFQSITLIALILMGLQLDWSESLSLVILPSTLLNALLSLPVYTLVADLANMLHPSEVEV